MRQSIEADVIDISEQLSTTKLVNLFDQFGDFGLMRMSPHIIPIHTCTARGCISEGYWMLGMLSCMLKCWSCLNSERRWMMMAMEALLPYPLELPGSSCLILLCHCLLAVWVH